nr:Wzy polymerase domain-containing protein [uncultured Rhodoferax sp.]
MPAAVPLLVSWGCAAVLLGAIGLKGKCTVRGYAEAAIANAWLLAALLSAAMGLLQYFGHGSLLSPWVSSGTAGEAYANLRQRNQFASLCSIGLLALLWKMSDWGTGAAPRAQEAPPPSARHWLLWGLALLLLACGNAASGSRTGLLQWWVIAGLGVWWWLIQARAGHWSRSPHGRIAMGALAGLVVYLACLWLLPWLLLVTTGIESGGLMGRLNEEAGCASRRVLWANVLHLIALKPWLGWGWEELDYAHFMTLYPGERFCDILDNAHNLPLHLAVELGLPFSLLVCGGLAWMVARAKPWRERDTARQLVWGVLAVLGMHSLLEYPLWYGPFQMAVVLCVWILWTTTPNPVGGAAEESLQNSGLWGNSRLAPVFVKNVAIVLIVTVGFSAWSYWRVSQLYLPLAQRAADYQEDAMGKLRGISLFRNQVEFADLTTTPLTVVNAGHLHALAVQLLHFSPEPRVVEKAIESAVLLGRDDVAAYFLQRYRAAFPKEHAQWAAALPGDKAP